MVPVWYGLSYHQSPVRIPSLACDPKECLRLALLVSFARPAPVTAIEKLTQLRNRVIEK